MIIDVTFMHICLIDNKEISTLPKCAGNVLRTYIQTDNYAINLVYYGAPFVAKIKIFYCLRK